MELTGRIKVTGGGNISAELRGANLTASTARRGAACRRCEPPPPAPAAALVPSPSAEPRHARAGELRDNLPGADHRLLPVAGRPASSACSAAR